MTTQLQGPANTGGFGFAGQTYEPDANGIIEVPDEIVQEAKNHGFVPLSETPKPDTAGVDLGGLTIKQLVAFGQDALGLTLDPSQKKKDLIAAIEAAMSEKPETAGVDESAAA